MRLKWLNNLSGKHRKPYDLGLCKFNPGAKTAAKAWTQFASTAGRHDRHFCVGCVHATLRFFPCPGNGITVFTKGGAVPDAH